MYIKGTTCTTELILLARCIEKRASLSNLYIYQCKWIQQHRSDTNVNGVKHYKLNKKELLDLKRGLWDFMKKTMESVLSIYLLYLEKHVRITLLWFQIWKLKCTYYWKKKVKHIATLWTTKNDYIQFWSYDIIS